MKKMVLGLSAALLFWCTTPKVEPLGESWVCELSEIMVISIINNYVSRVCKIIWVDSNWDLQIKSLPPTKEMLDYIYNEFMWDWECLDDDDIKGIEDDTKKRINEEINKYLKLKAI